jgi:ubiquinone/menaquinone biosynthesis C-methylase UbiE
MNEDIDHYYAQHAQDYANFSTSSFSWNYIEKPGFDRFVSNFYYPETKILDLGCGSGRIIGHFVESGVNAHNIIGLDPNSQMLAITRRSLPGVKLIQAVSESLPFKDTLFDLVSSNLTLHNLDSECLTSTMQEAHRVLRPSGIFFFVDSVADPTKLNQWSSRQTPWGDVLNEFHHDMSEVLDVTAPDCGFKVIKKGLLPTEDAGLIADPTEYTRYSTTSFRIFGLLEKM